MGIEEIVNDPEWQLSLINPVATSYVGIPAHRFVLERREIKEIEIVVWALKNGLLYAVPINDDGKPFFAQGSYLVENFPKGQSPYQLINLVRAEREGVPGLAATFEYKAGKTPKGCGEAIPEGLDEARIEYTTWHNPVDGLTFLTSVQAHQLVEKGWIDVQLSLPTYENSNRTMTMEVSSLGERLRFNKNGNLEAPRLFWASPELKGVYDTVISGTRIDPLKTAVALINGYPSQRPLNIIQLVQYKSPTPIR